MKRVNYFIYSFLRLSVFVGLLFFSSCQKEKENVAEAVLASASALSFDAQNARSMVVTVYSDAEWVADLPDWISIEPMTGSGVTDVTVSVTDNIRDGKVDRPRKADLVFRGNTLASRAIVVVSQDGDKYRDVKNSTVTDVVNSEDESAVIVPDAQVAAITTKGVIVSDGKSNLFVSALYDHILLGDKVSFKGTKTTDNELPVISVVDDFSRISEGELSLGEPENITDKIDTYSSKSRSYVSFRGILRGNNVKIDGAEYRSVNILDPHESLDLSSINGHFVSVRGFYAGETTSYINVMVSEIISEGPSEIIYWFDDFAWVTPYADDYIAKGGTSSKPTVDDCVADKLSTDKGCPNIYTDCVNLDVNVLQALRDKGYEDLNPSLKTIYMQKHYFKYGATNKQSGLVLPAFATGADIKDEITVSFDWCNYMSSKGAIDVAEMVVEISGPGYVVTASGSESAKISDRFLTKQGENEMFWMTSTVLVKGATDETRITIRPAFIGGDETPDDPSSTYMRYYMDNIKVYASLE